MFYLDPALEEYATTLQWEKLKEWEKHGSQRLAAKALGIHVGGIHMAHKAVLKKAALHGYAPEYDMTKPAAPGFSIKGTTTLYDQSGQQRLQWVKTQQDAIDAAAEIQAAIDASREDIKRAKPVRAPKKTEEKLCALYPIGDHHIGMLAWSEETFESYNLEIAETLLVRAMDSLLDSAPACETGIVAFLGDLMHYDSYIPETPAHKNKLDASGRAPEMVRVTIKTIRYVVEAALKKHGRVHVIVEVGNHDPYSSIWIREFLISMYENDDRVTVDPSPRHYHFYQHEKCLIATHHGHGAKKDNLPMVMASDVPQVWGDTKFRYWFTGHLHHDHKKDYEGCSVEQVRVLPPGDHYSVTSGYRSMRDMKVIIFHGEYGEVARYVVNPDMLL